MLISSLVTKYRDFNHLIGFGVQLLMYLSAVMYPMVIAEKCRNMLVHAYNPLAYVIETARYMLLNVGQVLFWSDVYYCRNSRILYRIVDFNKTGEEFYRYSVVK
jgi:lipopolysaccharide transport system permease protein